MKKILLICVLLLAIVLSFAACGDNDSPPINNEGSNNETPHTHSFGEWEVTVKPTCTKDGTKVRYCSCGEKQSETIASLGHTPAVAVIEDKVEATYEADGSYNEVVRCATCNEKLSETSHVIPMLKHTPADAAEENRVEATCYSEGSYDMVVYCSDCGAELDRATHTIDKIAHTPATAVEEKIVDSTCYSVGSKDMVVYCSVAECHKELERSTESIGKKSHTPATAVEENRIEPTFEKDGSYQMVIYCSVAECHKELERTTHTLDMLVHHPGSVVIENEIAATCTKAGSYDEVVYCLDDNCGHKELSRKTVSTDMIPHIDGTAVEENRLNATCYSEGKYESVVYCNVCSAELSRTTVTLQKIAHSPASVVIENRVEANCTASGSYDEVVYCSVENCKAEISRTTKTINALGHTEVIDEAVEPTCTATGLTEGKHCSVCNEVLIAQTTVNSLGHTEVIDNAVEPTCTNAGLTEGKHCPVCETVIVAQTILPATGHQTHVTKLVDETIITYITTDDTNYPFTVSGNQIISTNKSNNSSSTYTITASCDFTLKLQYKVSSEQNYDKLIIKLNSSTLVTASGTSITTFTDLSIDMIAGDKVTITYSKDDSEKEGSNCIYVNILTDKTQTIQTEKTELIVVYQDNIASVESCQEDKYCVVCSELLCKKIDHIEVIDEAVAPTCTDTGLTAGKHCSLCNGVIIEQVVIPANGHNYVNNACTVCQEIPENIRLLYTLNEDGESYSVSGLGSYSGTDIVILDTYKGLPVTSISSKAFSGITSLTSISIPSSITSIGDDAFYNCNGLNAVYISDLSAWCRISFAWEDDWDEGYWQQSYANPLRYAGNLYLNGEIIKDLVLDGIYPKAYTFHGASFDSVILSEGQGSIPDGAFRSANIKFIYIPNTVTYIGNYAFNGCSGLKILVIDNVTTVKDWALWGPNLEVIYCKQTPSGFDDMDDGNSHFRDDIVKGYTSVKIGDIVYGIKGTSVYILNVSKSISGFVDIPSSITVDGNAYTVRGINEYAFYNCTLMTGISIPASISSIEGGAFDGCTSLENLHISNIANWCGKYFEYSSSNPMNYAENIYIDGVLVSDIVIPDGVTSIAEYAFYGCKGIESVTIPYSVTTVYRYAFHNSSISKIYTEHTSMPSGWQEDGNFYGIEIEWGYNNIHNNSEFDYVLQNGNAFLTKYKGEATEIEIPATIDGYTVIGFGTIFGGNTTVQAVIIPDGIKEIPAYAFKDCATLESITLPASVTKIGQYAFYGCSSLEDINLPNGIKTIGDYAFASCNKLSYITLPEGLISIGYYSFRGCSSIKEIVVPSNVTSIGQAAFANCTSLESITLPFVGGSVKSATDTYQYPFGYIFGTSSCTGCYSTNQYYYGSSITSTTSSYYYIPTSLKRVTITGGNILSGAFYNCGYITHVTLPDNITSIGNDAFYNCDDLICVNIPDSVTSIGSSAFYDCASLISIAIPESITSISNYAFNYCSSLTIYCEVTEKPSGWTSYWNNSNRPVVWGCVEVGATADGLQYVITEEGTLIIGYVGTSSELIIPEAINGVAVTAIGNKAFYYCESLTRVSIPDSVTSIGSSAFYNCRSLTSVTMENRVTSIGASAFYYCENLTSIAIPNSVTSIGASAFYYCSNLIICCEATEQPANWASNWNPSSRPVMWGCAGIITNDDGVQYAITKEGAIVIGYTGTVTEVTIPDTINGVAVISIMDKAFYNCDNLTSIAIGNMVSNIGNYAFYDCDILTNVIIPNSVTTIGNYAFDWCTSLASVTIGNGITSIGTDAFYYCGGLNAVYISDIAAWCNISFETNYANPLYYATNLYLNGELVSNIIIPDNVTNIGNYAFYNCTSIISVTIGNGITSIGSSAFFGCSKLIEVINKSSLDITAGSNSNGYAAYYAKEVHSGESKIVNNDNLLFYAYNGVNYLIGYTGTDSELVLPNNYNGDNYQIYKYAFSGCTNIANVTISDGVTIIGDYAFSDCTSLRNVTIGNSVTSIGGEAFHGCTSLTSINIPDNVTSIGYGAFSNCTNLKSMTIGSGVTSIGDHAFYSCTSIENITVSPNNQYYTSIDGNLYNKNATTLIQYAIGKTSTSFTIPDSVTSIGGSAFRGCTNLTSVTIGNSVTSISGYAFYDCTNLTNVTIGSNVTSIGSNAFGWCDNLTSVTFENPTGWWRSSSSTATSGTSISSSYLANASTAATYLTSTYKSYYWKRT